MKILVLTQKVDKNDDVLGAFHGWLEEFARQAESVIVICLEEGVHTLPQNVRVYSLGKEKGESRLKYTINFYKYIFQFRKEYDTVFVHMNPEYVVLGGLFWRMVGKRVGFWYTHRQVNLKLWLAEKFSHSIFTASGTSFGLSSDKIHVLGHGIDLKKFNGARQNADNSAVIKIISAGRITPIKNLDTIIEAINILREHSNISVKLHLLGAPTADGDVEYLKSLEKLVSEKGLSEFVFFDGSVSYADIPTRLKDADVVINACPTGGVDKAVVEAWASGVPTLVSNEAFHQYLEKFARELTFKERDSNELAKRLEELIQNPNRYRIGQFLQNKAKSHFGQDVLISRIIDGLQSK
jgi:glycosyltransferase involved in cell wall biosynthesis